MATQLSESIAATTSLDEGNIYEGIRRLKAQRLELSQSLDDYIKVRSNLQFKVDQEMSKNDAQKQIYSDMQETLKIAQSKVELACKEGQNFQNEADIKRQSVEQLCSAIAKEDEKQREWQSQWEENTKLLSEKFMDASELYGRDGLHIELENVRVRCAKKIETLETLESKLAYTEAVMNNLKHHSGIEDAEEKFLCSAQAVELHVVLDAKKKEMVMLANEISALKQEAAALITD